jgi:hypothetical protein
VPSHPSRTLLPPTWNLSHDPSLTSRSPLAALSFGSAQCSNRGWGFRHMFGPRSLQHLGAFCGASIRAGIFLPPIQRLLLYLFSVGPTIVMAQFEHQFGVISATVQGLLVSCMIATAALSSMFSGSLSDRISRTYTISFGGLIYAVGCVIACSARVLPQLFIGRCIAGIGEGLFISRYERIFFKSSV